ncbi:MAG: proprotein convertase P-domain-containing protein [Phycisphaerales bacterium]|nr:proprotein convertase P-domain-containing protein [Phycisphaerales bacterium]
MTPLADAATFSNPTAITINDNANASLYPSTINVPLGPPIQSIAVSLNQFSHSRISDLTVLLVSPSGKAVQLLANAPGSTAAAFNFVLADSGRPLNGDPMVKVTYRPTVVPAPAAMPAPAPGLPYLTSFDSLIGDDAAGTWSLYVRDNVTGEVGSIATGWSLSINGPLAASISTEYSYQGVLRNAGGPLSGVYDVRADLWRSPNSTAPQDKVASSTAFAVPIENGVFTTKFAPPSSSFDGRALWVEIAVKGPGDPSFVTLDGRAPLTAVPYASFALKADQAAFADEVGTVSWGTITNIPSNVLNAFSPWAATGTAINNTNTGNVLIGTTTGTSKLTVNGTIESKAGGVKFPDGSTQTTAVVSPIVASGSLSLDFSSIAAGGDALATINGVGGLELTDVVVISPQSDLPSGLSIDFARVSATSQFRFRLRNNSGAAINPPLIVFGYRIIR